MKELDVFISGEMVDLCIPTEEFSYESDWYSWFNESEITKYLEQGIYPNTRECQKSFFKSVSNPSRMTLIISNRSDYIGVISLSSIDRVKNKCDIALVVNNKLDRRNSAYLALEAMSLMTTHAFEALGMLRVEAGQHVNLAGWQQRMELIGYRIEGIHRNKFIKGRDISDSVSISCTLCDFDRIVSHRGALWDSKESMKNRIKKLPKNALSKQLKDFFDDSNEYYNTLFLS